MEEVIFLQPLLNWAVLPVHHQAEPFFNIVLVERVRDPHLCKQHFSNGLLIGKRPFIPLTQRLHLLEPYGPLSDDFIQLLEKPFLMGTSEQRVSAAGLFPMWPVYNHFSAKTFSQRGRSK